MAKYDDARFHTRQIMPLAEQGVAVPGTAASNTTLIRLRIPKAITIDEADILMNTGGTAAGPTVILQKSLAGTGAAAGFATYNIGTAANNTGAGMTVTSTTFADGDHLLIVNAAGTAASTPNVAFTLGFKETFS